MSEVAGLFAKDMAEKDRVFYGDPVFHVIYNVLGRDLAKIDRRYPYLDPTLEDPGKQREIARVMFWATDDAPARHIFLPPHFSTDHKEGFKDRLHQLLQVQPNLSMVEFEGQAMNIARLAQDIVLPHEWDEFIQAYPKDTNYAGIRAELERNYALMQDLMIACERGDGDQINTRRREMRRSLFESPQEMRAFFDQLLESISYKYAPNDATRVIDTMFDESPGIRHTASTIAARAGLSRDGKDGRSVDDILNPATGGNCFEPPEVAAVKVVGSSSKPPLLYALAGYPFSEGVDWPYQNLWPTICGSKAMGRCPLAPACPVAKAEFEQQEAGDLQEEASDLLERFLSGINNFQARNNTIILIG